MRIIAGRWRGRRLLPPRDRTIRPMTDRVRQAVFDILTTRMEFDGIDVLDLFSGSGSLGLEALSRGAHHITFVENSREAIEILRQNVHSFACDAESTIHQADVFWYLSHATHAFDLVLLDPPYRLSSIHDLPRAVSTSGVVRPGAFVVMEHSRETAVPAPVPEEEAIRRSFGQTGVLMFRVPASPTLSPERE
jgi:16S rRNA (guanine966-N2)-methyltransferase